MMVWCEWTTPKYIIDAVIEYEWVREERVARGVEPRPNGEYSDEQLNEYNEFIVNVCNAIEVAGFTIINDGQSAGSYSYYIDFMPVGTDGKPMDDAIRVRFRISDHPLRNGRDNIGVKAVFKSFWFGNEKYENMYDLVSGIEKACEAIKKGDWSQLQRL